nr:hypothetical protein Iba_chr01aCG13350 [Ipomoea batatas]
MGLCTAPRINPPAMKPMTNSKTIAHKIESFLGAPEEFSGPDEMGPEVIRPVAEQEIGNSIYIYYEPNTLEEAQRNMLSSIARKANSDSGKVRSETNGTKNQQLCIDSVDFKSKIQMEPK